MNFNQVLSLLFIFHISNPLISLASTLSPYDRQVLLRIQDHFGGPNPQFHDSFLDCCDYCNHEPVSCNGKGQILQLTIDSNKNLSGEIPSTIGQLSSLRYLTINGSGFVGHIPSSIGKLINLVEMVVQNTSITGRIPGSLGRLKNLQVLDLSNNNLTSHLPYSLGMLSNLYYLNLSSNYITGKIRDSLGKLVNLESLSLGPNRLSGPIPNFLYKLHHLTHLDLSANMMSGPLPEFVGSMAGLSSLDLSNNRFQGQIPKSICDLRSSIISLHSNQLSGPIPDCSWNHYDTYHLYLNNNQLTGPVPRLLAVASFYTLDLSNNKLIDASELFGGVQGGWVNIDLSNNLLKFNFSYANFPFEQINLNISHNMIYGSIPRAITQLRPMGSFDVSYNELCGQIPDSYIVQSSSPEKFEHNKCLCGAPLPPCSAPSPSSTITDLS